MKFQKVKIQSTDNNSDEIKQKKHKRITLLLCLLIPIITSAYFIFYTPSSSSTSYTFVHPITTPLSEDNTTSYKIYTTHNNIDVILVSNPSLSKCACSLTINAGVFYDTTDGLAHFCEHMLFLGNTKHNESELLMHTVQKHSGIVNAFTDLDRTTYFFSVNNEGLPRSIDVFASMFDIPLFETQYVDKEINAINSEHEKNINNDQWINYEIIKTESTDEHPYNSFGTGNNETLRSISVHELQMQLKEYFNTLYTPCNMKVALIANYTLNELEQLVNENFIYDKKRNDVHNKSAFVHNRNARINDNKLFNKGKYAKLIWYASSSGVNAIEISFVITPGVNRYYKTKPEDYMSYMLLYKGKGSLVRVLKEKNFVLNINAGVDESYDAFTLYKVKLLLSEYGVVHYRNVLSYVFTYIESIKRMNISANIYNDIKRIEDNAFNFNSKKEVHLQAVDLSMGMFIYEHQDMLQGKYMHSEYNESTIHNVMNDISINNAIVIFSTDNTTIPFNDNELQHCVNKTIHHYNNKEYHIINITNDTFAYGDNDNVNLSLRNESTRNKFISTIHSVPLPCYEQSVNSCNDDEFNPLIRNYNANVVSDVFYYKIDKSFHIPKENIIIAFTSHKYFLSNNKTDFLMLNLLTFMLNNVIDIELFDALDTGNTISFTLNADKLVLNIYCYSDKANVLIESVSNVFINAVPFINEDIFTQAVDRLISVVEENKTKYAFQINDDVFKKKLIHNHIIINDITKHDISQITYDTIVSFYLSFINDIHIQQSLIHGDVSSQHVNTVITYFNNIKRLSTLSLSTQLKQRELNSNTVVNFYFKNEFALERNHATTVYFQIGKESNKNIVYFEVFNKCIGAHFFAELRTQKQLGYIVKSGMKYIHNVMYYYITVQGTAKFPDEIEEDINESIRNAVDVECNGDTFWEIVNAVKEEINVKETNLLERSKVIWRYVERKGMINVMELLKELEMIKDYNEVREYMKEVFIYGNVRRFGVLNYAGNMNESDIEKRIGDVKLKRYSLSPENITKVEYFTDKEHEVFQLNSTNYLT